MRIKITERFERYFLQRLMEDDTVFVSHVQSVHSKYFDDENAYRGKICSLIREQWKDHGRRTTLDFMRELLSSLDEPMSSDCLDELDEIEDVHLKLSTEEFDALVQNFIFARKLQEATHEQIQLLKDGKLDQVRDPILKVYEKRIVTSGDSGVDYFNVDNRSQDFGELPPRMSTPFAVLNELLLGGIAIGEIWLIMGNVFKTQLLLQLALHAATVCRVPTIYFTLEVDKFVLGHRADCMLTGYPLEFVIEAPQKIKKRLQLIQEWSGHTPFIIRQFPMRTATVGDLRNYVTQWEAINNKKVGCVIIDYPDLLVPPKDTTSRQTLPTTEIYTQIGRWGQEQGVRMLVASQVTKEGGKAIITKRDGVAEDKQKVDISSAALTINMTEDEFRQGVMRLFIAKARNGTPFVEIPMRLCKPSYRFKEQDI